MFCVLYESIIRSTKTAALALFWCMQVPCIASPFIHDIHHNDLPEISHITLGTTNEPGSLLFKKAELILSDVFLDLGYTMELHSIAGARSLHWANTGEIDGVAFRVANLDLSIYSNLKRVATPLFIVSQSVISRTAIAVDGWQSMAEYVVAYERGTRFIEENLAMFKDSIMVSTSSQAMGLVQIGRADVTILNENTARQILDYNAEILPNLIINSPPITQIVLHPYINESKHPGLADRVAQVLATKMINH